MPAIKNRRLKRFRRRRLSLFSATMLLLNSIAVLLLVGSYFAPHVNPETFIWFSFLGLSYPFLLGINLLFVVYWLFRFRWPFIVSFIAIAAGWHHVETLAQFNVSDDISITNLNTDNYINVVSYNLRYQGRFLTGIPKQNVRTEIINTLDSLKANIYCLQEFHTNPVSKSNNNLQSIIDSLTDYEYYNTKMSVNADNFNEFGLAFFTKYPILKKETINFDNTINMAAFIDVLISTDTVRVYNVHLASIRFEEKDYQFIQNINKQDSEEAFKKGSKGIYTRLETAFKKRAIQANIIAKHMEKCKYPIIVCGDFNDTPTSYSYNIIKGNKLYDSFVQKGFWIAQTYNGKMPSFRIDHILADSNFVTKSYEVLTNTSASDHYPVVVNYELSTHE